jgi:hypothetical protein
LLLACCTRHAQASLCCSCDGAYASDATTAKQLQLAKSHLRKLRCPGSVRHCRDSLSVTRLLLFHHSPTDAPRMPSVLTARCRARFPGDMPSAFKFAPALHLVMFHSPGYAMTCRVPDSHS